MTTRHDIHVRQGFELARLREDLKRLAASDPCLYPEELAEMAADMIDSKRYMSVAAADIREACGVTEFEVAAARRRLREQRKRAQAEETQWDQDLPF